jgi:hypothetical protein
MRPSVVRIRVSARSAREQEKWVNLPADADVTALPTAGTVVVAVVVAYGEGAAAPAAPESASDSAPAVTAAAASLLTACVLCRMVVPPPAGRSGTTARLGATDVRSMRPV